MKSVNRFYQSGCRICGKLNGTYVNVLDEKNKLCLYQIHKFLKIEISNSDNFSKNICHTCIATLNDFATLFEQCQDYQQELSESTRSEDILRSRDVINAEGDDSGHQNMNVETDENHKPVMPNLIILNDRHHLSEGIEATDEERSSDPLLSEFDIAIDQEMNNATQNNTLNDLSKEENNPEIAHEKSNAAVVSESNDDWKIQKLPNSDMKLYLCNKCSKILLCEGAKKLHKCNGTENNLDISEDSPKKPKLESNC